VSEIIAHAKSPSGQSPKEPLFMGARSKPGGSAVRRRLGIGSAGEAMRKSLDKMVGLALVFEVSGFRFRA
jgi:hypothetical protein